MRHQICTFQLYKQMQLTQMLLLFVSVSQNSKLTSFSLFFFSSAFLEGFSQYQGSKSKYAFYGISNIQHPPGNLVEQFFRENNLSISKYLTREAKLKSSLPKGPSRSFTTSGKQAQRMYYALAIAFAKCETAVCTVKIVNAGLKFELENSIWMRKNLPVSCVICNVA